ncbi:5'-methylthioadenosine/S-adenosylhomocysteine nucleosidase [Actinomadura rayongensis]|uniref:Nucleoside phosphorylase domain-containing protein n=1 Tax=Actinomadura rayongensis TaxID=1429076 RepID=A0A6I4W3K3_9ACTN|nr:5'-methylthioadenosine/S-adenosylhomocysteine nucleosidase [Actinomadura rayongensis]MXQ63270.1 hypothetical protein [Actinomadura rayongensis]
MNERNRIHGIANYGGTTKVTNSAVGDRPVVNIGQRATAQDDEPKLSADVGVITILSVETQALMLRLGLERKPIGGLQFRTGAVRTDEGPVNVAAVQALGQGQRSTMAAYENLRRHFDPGVIVLVGIGGGIHRDVEIGDVVVATRVVYYDLRKELAEGTRRRGEEKEAPAATVHAVNAFFTDRAPAEFDTEDPNGTTRKMRMLHGPIGSGEAVVADEDAEIITYLAGFNDKILAVDMEAGGLSQASHERAATEDRAHGWAVIRGISDTADAQKNDEAHPVASWHAATALDHLLPYLKKGQLPSHRAADR